MVVRSIRLPGQLYPVTVTTFPRPDYIAFADSIHTLYLMMYVCVRFQEQWRQQGNAAAGSQYPRITASRQRHESAPMLLC